MSDQETENIERYDVNIILASGFEKKISSPLQAEELQKEFSDFVTRMEQSPDWTGWVPFKKSNRKPLIIQAKFVIGFEDI